MKLEDIKIGAIKYTEVKLEKKCRKTEKHFLIKLQGANQACASALGTVHVCFS